MDMQAAKVSRKYSIRGSVNLIFVLFVYLLARYAETSNRAKRFRRVKGGGSRIIRSSP